MDEPDSRKTRAIEFARRLLAARVDKGLSQSDLATRVSALLPEKRSFSRASISRYESGENVPGPATLGALARVLGKEPAELLPPDRIAATPRAPISMQADGEGNVKLSLDVVVPFDIAMQIMALLPRNK